MSKVLDELSESDDPVDQELSRTLRIYQSIKASHNLARSIGYEPRDIKAFGAVEVIERRIANLSSGFDEVPAKDSYEAIVLKYPDRFKSEIVVIASNRLNQEEAYFSPTDDTSELDLKVKKLLARKHLPFPKGSISPQKSANSSIVFLRDPRVKAFVLKRSNGQCECCSLPAPFKTPSGLDYLEVHHMKPLAQGGSDRVQKSVAVCPNCHRALHYSSDAAKIFNIIYLKITHLIRE